jgi:hypothetical protein
MRWLEALDTGDPRRLFAVMSAFPGRASLDRAYSYLGQELPVDCRFELLEIHTRGRWAAASVRHSPPNGLPPTYLLHPLAATADGAKIFPEAILYHPDSRARSLLNESVFRHLEKQVSEEAVAELRELLDAHEQKNGSYEGINSHEGNNTRNGQSTAAASNDAETGSDGDASTVENELATIIRKQNLATTTPMDALELLQDLQERLED